jgi:hypothetical protein
VGKSSSCPAPCVLIRGLRLNGSEREIAQCSLDLGNQRSLDLGKRSPFSSLTTASGVAGYPQYGHAAARGWRP